MTIYYVSGLTGSNRNTGLSSTAALKTIQAAADKTLPGDIVEVMNGTYTRPRPGGFVVEITRSGTVAAPITFQAMAGHKPIVSTAGQWGGIVVRGAAYINIVGFEVVGGAKGITPEYAESQKLNKLNPATAGDGIHVKKSATGAIAHHVVIENNTVHDQPGGGIVIMRSDYITIRKNTTFGNANWSPYAASGISLGFAEGIDQDASHHNFIEENTSYDNRQYIPFLQTGTITDGNGIIVDSNNLSGYTGRTLVQNNVTYNNGGTGIHAFNADHVDMLYNVAYMNNQTPTADGGQMLANKSSDVKIQNNIMVAPPRKRINGSEAAIYERNIYSGDITPTLGLNDFFAGALFGPLGDTPANPCSVARELLLFVGAIRAKGAAE